MIERRQRLKKVTRQMNWRKDQAPTEKARSRHDFRKVSNGHPP